MKTEYDTIDVVGKFAIKHEVSAGAAAFGDIIWQEACVGAPSRELRSKIQSNAGSMIAVAQSNGPIAPNVRRTHYKMKQADT